MSATIQWESDDPRARLDIPAARTATQRYRWSAPAPIGLAGTCAEYVLQDGAVTLRDVLTDTSERIHGTTLTKRVTWRSTLTIIGPLAVFSMGEEAAAVAPEESPGYRTIATVTTTDAERREARQQLVYEKCLKWVRELAQVSYSEARARSADYCDQARVLEREAQEAWR
jgi:hypothetical protein